MKPSQVNASTLFLSLIATVFWPFGANADSGQPVALLLSNWKYQHLAPLVTPEADLAAMRRTLEKLDPPYHVTELANATSGEMESAVEAFVKRHAGNPVVLVYVSGHGLQVAGVNYLTGVDVNLEEFSKRSEALRSAFPAGDEYQAQLSRLQRSFAEEQMLSVEWMIALLGKMSPEEAAHSHVKMIFIDACREPFPEESPAGLAEAKSVFGGKSAAGLAPVVVSERPGIFVGLSAAANQQANQNDGERLRVKSGFLSEIGSKGRESFLWDHYRQGGTAAELVEGNLPSSFFTERLTAEIARGGTLEQVFNRTGEMVHRDSAALVRDKRLNAVQTPAKYSLYYGDYTFSRPGVAGADPADELAAIRRELSAARAELGAKEKDAVADPKEINRLREQLQAVERARDEALHNAAKASPIPPSSAPPSGGSSIRIIK